MAANGFATVGMEPGGHTGALILRQRGAALRNGALNDFGAGQRFAINPSFKSTLSRRGQLPVHVPDETFSTSFGGTCNVVDTTPATTTKHSGNSALIPPLGDLVAGLIDVVSRDGRCLRID